MKNKSFQAMYNKDIMDNIYNDINEKQLIGHYKY